MALRILQLTYSTKPRGGVVHALSVAEALAARGHDVRLAALATEGGFFREVGVPDHLIAFSPDGAESFDVRIARMIEAYRDGLRDLVADTRPDIVHAQDCLSANAALALRDEGLVGSVIRTVHHVDDFISPSLIACQDRSILEPDLVLCVSRPWAERLAADFGIDAPVVTNGVDTRRFRPPTPAERAASRMRSGVGSRLVVLTVGGVEPRKGSLVLLEAFARLREELPERDPLLVMAGGATLFDYRSEIERFERLADRLGVTQHVRRTGPISDAEMDDLFRAADCFAFPSVKEGFGLAPLEALAAGLPVVATRLDVFSDFLLEGSSALLIEPGDSDALTAALRAIATDERLRRSLSVTGVHIASRFGWDRSAAAHEEVYERFLARDGARRQQSA